jgi:hypothetical protein
MVYVNGEVDKTSIVTRIIDGDTFDISTGERIRLADVDAPEYYESGYSQAKNYLESLINGKTVYLDIDDIYTYDYSGTGNRLVCVAYVDYDSTHLMNVNKALQDEGYAEISNYYNEFSPYSWTLLVPKNGNSESTPSPCPTPSHIPSPSITPTTPTPEPLSDSLEDYITVGISVFAFIFVIGVLLLISRMNKTKN